MRHCKWFILSLSAKPYKENHPRFPCLLLRDALFKNAYFLHEFYVFAYKLNVASTATIKKLIKKYNKKISANGSSLLGGTFPLTNSLKLIVYCFPFEETTWRKMYNLLFFILKLL